jgi:hypothetical protein
MNFADEPYVRLYTRKTLTHKLLGWEGRAVLRAMIDEFDPAGIFEIRGDAAHCISAVTDIPLEVVQVGLARLLETETWIVTGRAITWPTYEEAQNCRRSDRLRQRESRKARAVLAVTDVTAAPAETQRVTEVTKCHSPSPPPSAPSHPPTQEEEGKERAQAHAAAPLPPTSPRSGRRRPEPAEGAPLVWHTLKGWDAPETLENEAVMHNISREYFRLRVSKAKNKPIGGRDGVLDREQWVRDQFAFWVVDQRAQPERAGPGGLGMAAKQHNPGMTGFESLKETV